MLLERTSSVRAHRVQSSVKKVSSPSVDLLQKAFVPATVDNTVLFNQVGSADDKIIWQAGERKVTIRPIGFGSVLLSDTPPTNTATLSVSGAATNIERTFADGNVNLFDISGDAGNPLDARFIPHFRSAREEISSSR